MSKWEKLIHDILLADKNLRFEQLAAALVRMGYVMHQPRSGSSHCTFRKSGCPPITIPRHIPVKKAYIEMVRDIVQDYLEQEEKA